MIFVFDECLPPKIARALRELGEEAYVYDELEGWDRGAADVDWIPTVCEKGWCIVTSDRFRNPQERLALRQHNARVILLGTKSLPFWEEVRLVVNRWEQIKKEVKIRKPPYILRFTPRGREPQEIRV